MKRKGWDEPRNVDMDEYTGVNIVTDKEIHNETPSCVLMQNIFSIKPINTTFTEGNPMADNT